MFMYTILVVILIIAINCQDQQLCNIEPDDRLDCGNFAGVNEDSCIAKGCCWRVRSQAKQVLSFGRRFLQSIDETTPWCYYNSQQENVCKNIDFKGAQNAGFEGWYDGMYREFMKNLNIYDEGGVVAAPDNNTPGGSYIYHWERDAALTMRTFMDINDFQLEKIQFNMQKYINWVEAVQHDSDPNGINVLIEPKYELYTRKVYDGPWCRPQTDGPGLRATTLIEYAFVLLRDGTDQDKQYVQQYLFNESGTGVINIDLNWIIQGWRENGCDLWEEVRSDDFFWNRMAFHQAMIKGAQLANQLGFQDKYTSVAEEIKPTLYNHYNGEYVYESLNRLQDSSVVHAFVTLNEDVFDISGEEVAGTIKNLNNLFCQEYTINQSDNQAEIPGILYGRYKGDTYAGGNPWQLLTAALAENFYQLALQIKNQVKDDKVEAGIISNWQDIIEVNQGMSGVQFAQVAKSAGDAVMYRMYSHINKDNADFNVTEQMDKNTGDQTSAKRLTWSYANVLRVLNKYVMNEELQNL